jgi:hypothetical protein
VQSNLAIVGITRFSVVGAPHLFAATTGRSQDEADRIIFAPERMRTRFQLFETLALPSIDAIAKRYVRFRYLILISNALPSFWQARLAAITSHRPWCRILRLAREESLNARARQAAADFANGAPLFSFRIDDDDALSANYLDALVAHADIGSPVALTFADGIYLRTSDFAAFAIRRPLIAIGLGYLAPNADRTIFDLGSHMTIPERGTRVVEISGGPHWIRSVHSQNDSELARAHFDELQRFLAHHALREILRSYFPHTRLGRSLLA